MCQKIGEETGDVITSQEKLNVDLQRRRHAINITNNPGYRVSLIEGQESMTSFSQKRLYLYGKFSNRTHSVALFSLFFFITFVKQYKNMHQALHNSHSTLDRTCSDSVVSLKHRKSTSDLTNDDTFRKENENASSNTVTQKHRRRGSSKGGLAYLVEKRDSRRGSRESVISQQTNFSNEDIGPLTSFQQTQRGRQRRTSNFLELPGKITL